MPVNIYDSHGRRRNKVVAFCMSPEENEQINFAVALSGRSRTGRTEEDRVFQ